MSLSAFLIEVGKTGHGRVADTAPPEPAEVEAARAVLRELEEASRVELAHEPPPLSIEPAVWAAVTFYRAAQLLVDRRAGEATVREMLSRPCPGPRDAATSYAVDLSLRHLPDLIVLAREASPADPLTRGLLELAQRWPLSSVGVSGVSDTDPQPFLADACLRQLYVDRILATRDASRLDHEGVRRAVRHALGPHPELCPEIAALL